MVEDAGAANGGKLTAEDEISAFDAASYARHMSEQLAIMCREAGLTLLADSLRLSRDVAAAAMADLHRRQPAKAAPDDAA